MRIRQTAKDAVGLVSDLVRDIRGLTDDFTRQRERVAEGSEFTRADVDQIMRELGYGGADAEGEALEPRS